MALCSAILHLVVTHVADAQSPQGVTSVPRRIPHVPIAKVPAHYTRQSMEAQLFPHVVLASSSLTVRLRISTMTCKVFMIKSREPSAVARPGRLRARR